MIAKIVICVTAKQASVGLWRFQRLSFYTIFANDEAGHHAFRAFLRQHADMPIHLIIDTVEEDFRLETLPHTTRGTRKAMVERKLNQLYRNTGYRTALFVGREPDKRRDDRMLLMSLTNADIVAPWAAAIEQLQAPLAGAYLLPIVSQLLIRSLKLNKPDLLLMTRQGSGLRQTYFCGGYLRISRLTPLAGMDEHEIEQLYSNETEKTRLYLISLRMITRDSRLHLVFPTADAVDSQLGTRLESSQGVSCEVIAPAQLAQRCGLDVTLLHQYPELLHMQALASHTPIGNLAPARQTRQYQLHKLRFGIYAASTLCLTLAAAVAGANLLIAADLDRQLQAAAAETRRQEQLYDEVAKNFPKTSLPGRDLKTAVELAGQIGALNRTPQRMMQVVSAALDAQPEILLNRMRWKLTEDPAAQDEEEKSVPAGGNIQPLASPPVAPSGFYETAYVDGEIRNFNGDYRYALESVYRLVEGLKQSKAVAQVAILQQPVNTSSLVNLQGSTLDEQAQQLPAAQFKIKLMLKPEAAP